MGKIRDLFTAIKTVFTDDLTPTEGLDDDANEWGGS